MSGTTLDQLDPLVTAAAAGDRAAFGALVEATSTLVASIALAIVRDLDASREIAQDVFLAAWRDLGQLRNAASFLPWLRQITRNRAHHVLRTRIRTRRRLEGADEALLESVADPRPDAVWQLINREDRDLLAAALADLPDDTREVLTLFYREGQSTAHVAALLGLSEAAVRQRLSRARASLRAVVLTRTAQTLTIATPDRAFTAAILAALPLALPGGATGIAAATIKVGHGAIVTFLLSSAGVIAGAVGGVAGFAWGPLRLARAPHDAREARELRHYVWVGGALLAGLTLLFPVGSRLTGWAMWPFINFALVIAAIMALQQVWLPRILARRRAEAERRDPVAAAALRRRTRRWTMIGWTLGLTFGTLGVLCGVWFSR